MQHKRGDWVVFRYLPPLGAMGDWGPEMANFTSPYEIYTHCSDWLRQVCALEGVKPERLVEVYADCDWLGLFCGYSVVVEVGE